MEIRCEWDDRYPPESCPTRILHQFTLERMDKTCHYITEPKKKYKHKPYTEEQKLKKRIANSRRAGAVGNMQYFREDHPDEL